METFFALFSGVVFSILKFAPFCVFAVSFAAKQEGAKIDTAIIIRQISALTLFIDVFPPPCFFLIV